MNSSASTTDEAEIAEARGLAPGDAARLRVLVALADALSAATSVEALVAVVAPEALRAAGAGSLSVSRWEPEPGRFLTLVTVGEEPAAGQAADGHAPPDPARRVKVPIVAAGEVWGELEATPRRGGVQFAPAD